MAQWHFAEQRLDDVDDETTVSKNFSRESRQLTGVFVREFFQNVLDARVRGEDGKPIPARVRIAFLDKTTGFAPSDLHALLDGLDEHLTEAGHNADLWQDDRANALILEEFGTTGLDGDTQNSRAKGPNERWANFWFGEGKRTKGGASLGRAGQGKITYHLISGTQTVFALTRQEKGQNDLLFGKCIVQRTHQVGGRHYKRHGYWPLVGKGYQPLPSNDQKDIDAIRSKFGLKRNGERGTSWIIPYVDAGNFSKERLIREILRDFFFSVMADGLTVEVMGTVINQSSLAKLVAEHASEDLPTRFVTFLTEAITLPPKSFVHAGHEWYGKHAEAPMLENALSDEDLDKARQALDSEKLVALRLPIPISPVGSDTQESEISIFLQKPDQLEKTKEIYVRSGLVIGEEQYLRSAPGRYFGLMLANDVSISELLGFAEEASHMKWNSNEQEVVSRYSNAGPVISRVRHSLPKLAKLLIGHSSTRQDDALIKFLSIPGPGNTGRGAKTTKIEDTSDAENSNVVDKPPSPPPKATTRFRIDQTASKWTLGPGPGAKSMEFPVKLRIDLAYATMPGEGNPFKVYHRFEFDLGDEVVHNVLIRNGKVLLRDLNRLEVELADPSFELTVDGFSEHALKSRITSITTESGGS